MEIRNKRLSYDEFSQERKEVLAQWPTGKEVDLDEAIEFHKNLPPGKVMVNKLIQAKQKGEIYSITGMGKTTLEQQIELLKYVESEGQAEFLGTSVDSFTRVGNYEETERGLKESLKTGKSHLNGFPVVNYGVAGVRKLVESVNVPITMKYGAADTRLIDEIGLAGGHTHTAAEGLFDFWQHNSKLSLETVLRKHQYVQRLVGYYEERGVKICLGTQGLYAGGAVPPSLTMAAVLTQVLMMAEQGAKNIKVHFLAQGNLVQDVAGAKTIRRLAQEYLTRYGYPDVSIFMSLSFSLVKYPAEFGPAFAVICYNSLISRLCGAEINDIRTAAEAITIPTKEDIVHSLRCAKVATNLLKGQKIEIDSKALEIETTMLEWETKSILDKVIDLGDGDVIIGTIRAVEVGVLDNPFASSPAVACKVMGVRDSEGAVRYLNFGNLPFTKDIVEFHKAKISEREKKWGQKVNYETVIDDLMSISRGGYMVEEMGVKII